MWRQLEGLADVRTAACGRQRRLGGSCANPPQGLKNRQAETSGEIGGLIEAASAPPGAVKRHWNRRVHAGDHVATRVSRERCEPPRKAPASVVLERVQDVAESVLIRTDRAMPID
jgi:hypothetical protein